MAMEDKEYLKYLRRFRETKNDYFRHFPNILPTIKDYDFVEGVLDGYELKWVARVGKDNLKDLISEKENNQKCSYEICYTEEEMEGFVPAEFSSIIKCPHYEFLAHNDVLVSRLLNYFEISTVYNRRIEAKNEIGYDRTFIISVNFLKENERFENLADIMPNNGLTVTTGLFDINYRGIKYTLEVIEKYLVSFLKRKHINFTQKDIDDYLRFMAKSIMLRTVLFKDIDFRDGNAGILIDVKNNSFKGSAPNFDFGESFDIEEEDSERFNLVDEYIKLYPEDFCDIDDKLQGLFVKDKSGKCLAEKLVNEHIRSSDEREFVLSVLTEGTKKFSEKRVELIDEHNMC